MEKKRAQRIIGVTAAIALIVILLPVLFNKEATTQSTVQAPPFVEQPTQNPEATSSVAENNISSQADTMKPGVSENITVAEQSNPIVNPEPSTQESNPVPTTNNISQGPSPAVGVNPKTNLESNSTNSPSATPNNINRDPNMILQDRTRVTSENQIRNTMQPVQEDEGSVALNSNETANQVTVSKKPQHISQAHTNTMIEKLKNPAWAVQMGSFKNKTNAERLVNSLRSKGFKAYLHEIKTVGGTSTRVYVGPLFKRNAALALVGKMQRETNIHGMVVSYKPLEL